MSNPLARATLILNRVDLNAELEGGTFRRVNVSLIDVLLELQDAETLRCLNLLSIPLLATGANIPDLGKVHQLSLNSTIKAASRNQNTNEYCVCY